MLKWCLIISFILHLFCILFFSFSLSLNPEFEILSINFLGSIFKEADFLFAYSLAKAIPRGSFRDSISNDIFLLPNHKKSIKLYNEDFKKPFLSLNTSSVLHRKNILQIYKNIEAKLKQSRDVKQREVNIPPPNWEKIKLEME